MARGLWVLEAHSSTGLRRQAVKFIYLRWIKCQALDPWPEKRFFPTCVSGPGCAGGPGGTYTTTAYEDGLLKSITANGGGFLLSSITYHPSGMPNVITHSSTGSMVETITQAANGMARPDSITITAPNETVPFTTGTYAYDAAGNIKTMGSDHFRYDKYSRLVEAQMASISPARTQTYGFDVYGNMTSVATTSGPTETFQVIGTSNRITLPAPVALAQYDAGGNLTSWSDPSTTATYTWDLFNRMTHWGNGAEGWSYVYTADDERLWAVKDVAGATYSNWTFRGLGNEVLVRDERRPSPTPRALTQYAYREGKLMVSLKVGGAFRDHGLDHLGSIRATAELSLGTLGVRHTYFPFGREATSTSLDAEVMKFTGHERDLQSTTSSTADDLDYMHARYRSPLTSRFLSTDKALDVAAISKRPQGWNRYAYVSGNPLKFSDPTGNCQDPGGEGTRICIDAYIPTKKFGIFKGDNRGPNPNGGTFRTQQTFGLPTKSKGAVSNPKLEAGISKSDLPGKVLDLERRASVDAASVSTGSGGIRATAAASDGLGFGAAPDLHYDFTLQSGSDGRMSVSGFHTAYPSFEVWQYNDGAAPQQIYNYDAPDVSVPEGLILINTYVRTGGGGSGW